MDKNAINEPVRKLSCTFVGNWYLIHMEDNEKMINETNVSGSRIFVEDGEVKTVLSEDIQKSGYMSVEDSKRITLEAVKKIYELNGKL